MLSRLPDGGRRAFPLRAFTGIHKAYLHSVSAHDRHSQTYLHMTGIHKTYLHMFRSNRYENARARECDDRRHSQEGNVHLFDREATSTLTGLQNAYWRAYLHMFDRERLLACRTLTGVHICTCLTENARARE